MIIYYSLVFIRVGFNSLWLQLLRSVIGLKISRHLFNLLEAETKGNLVFNSTLNFSRALSKMQVIARNYD